MKVKHGLDQIVLQEPNTSLVCAELVQSEKKYKRIMSMKKKKSKMLHFFSERRNYNMRCVGAAHGCTSNIHQILQGQLMENCYTPVMTNVSCDTTANSAKVMTVSMTASSVVVAPTTKHDEF